MGHMIGNDIADTTLRQFVLGALDDQTRLLIEERLVTVPETFEALELAEGALAEAYVDGELSPEDRQRFEQVYLTTTERCRQVTVLRLVRDRARTRSRPPAQVARTPSTKLTAPRGAARMPRGRSLAVAGSLGLAVGWSAWLMVQQASLERELAAVTRQRLDQQRTLAQMSNELAQLSARAADLEGRSVVPAPGAAERARPVVSAPGAPATEDQLPGGVLRNPGPLGRVAIRPGAAVVSLILPLPDRAFSTYRAAVFGADGTELWSVAKLGATTAGGGRTLRVVAPSELLPAGDYEMRVSGVAVSGRVEPIATYPFRRPSQAGLPPFSRD